MLFRSILGLELDRERMTLKIDATDASGFGVAEVKQDDQSVIVYPDQLANGIAVPLDNLVHQGWNTVDQIIVYDANGLPTMLRLKDDKLMRSKHSASKARLDVETYEIVPWQGAPRTSNFPLLNFLKSGGAK